MKAAELEEGEHSEEDVIPPPRSPKEASGGDSAAAMLSAADGTKILVRLLPLLGRECFRMTANRCVALRCCDAYLLHEYYHRPSSSCWTER